MHPYEIISLDLDGTLLDKELGISPRNRAALRRCRDLGVKVLVSSGRMHASTVPFWRALEVDTPIISYNGACIKYEATGQVLLHERLDETVTEEVVAFCAREGLHLNYYLDDTLYVAQLGVYAQRYASRSGVPVEAVGDLRCFAGRPPTKLLIVSEPERIRALAAELAPRYSQRAYVTTSMNDYLEFMPRGVDKGKALAVAAEHFGVPREKVIAFGDAANDVPALQWAGLGVAMENAEPAALAVADRVAPPHDQDGVAVVLEELFGLD